MKIFLSVELLYSDYCLGCPCMQKNVFEDDKNRIESYRCIYYKKDLSVDERKRIERLHECMRDNKIVSNF